MTKKPRSRTISLDLGAPIAVSEISIAPDGRIQFKSGVEIHNPAESHIQTSYDRPKGPKVLYRISHAPGAPNADPNASLLAYSTVLACDTNTAEVHGAKVSVASIFELERESDTPSHIMVTIRPRVAFEFRGVTGPPERLGWVHALTSILNPAAVAPLALIVDAHQAELEDINHRRKPLLDGFILPPWATLVYASADAGKEFLANRMISNADSEASALLDGLRRGVIAGQGLRAVTSPHLTHLRMYEAVRADKPGVYNVAV